ncbi:MAG: GNAT family N-acetyltransferase [Dehalococcoidales bacterium]
MIKIVKAEEQHIPEICKLWLEFMYFHRDIDYIFTPRDGAVVGFEEEMVRRLMKFEDGLVLIALDGEQVVAYSLSEIRSSKGLKLEKFGAIDHVAVTASYRRRGVGEKMVSEILKWFKSRNIERVELEVLTKNPIGYSFWKKHGFTDYRHRLYRRI